MSLHIDKTTPIGVVGLGRMGANIARCLHEKGFNVTALFDIDTTRTTELAHELSTTAYSALAEVTAQSSVIITVVTDDAAMSHIFSHPDDNLLMNATDTVFINCATVTPQVHIDTRHQGDLAGAYVLETLMASSIPQAREGSLYLMCGGDESVFNAAHPVLNALSSTCTYTGETGSAAKIKALVNMVMNINTAGLAEGLGLADALGLDLNLVRKIFSQTGANSRVLETDGLDMQLRGHDTYFSSAHAAKDSGIALKLGEDAGLPMVLARATKNQYQALCDHGLGELDKSGISELTFISRQPTSAAPVSH